MTSKSYHLVHVNIAVLRFPLDHPQMKGFLDIEETIDQIASQSIGYLSQPTSPDSGEIFKYPELFNLSIWESVEHLKNFTYSGEHAAALRRRREWFIQEHRYKYVLYWEVAGHIPKEREVKERLKYLRQNGPTPFAFTFTQPFSVEDVLAYSPK